ncbi:MAG TPA: MFS transporter [Nitrososphaera sp.]
MFSIGQGLSIKPGVVALSLVSLIVMMGSSMATPSLALYAGHYLGANELLVGAVIAGFAIGRLIFDVPSGFLADRLGLHRTMILGLGVLVGAALLAGLAPSYWILFSARILEGIGSSIYVSAAVSFILLSSESSKRATTMGTYQSILMLGPIVGPIVGAPIAVLYGYNSPYLAFAVMMAVALGVISMFSKKGRFRLDRIDNGESQNSARTSNLSFYINTAGVATFGFAFLRAGIYSTGMPLFAYGSLALTVFDVGIILTVAALANLAASYFSGRITRMYGMKKPLFLAILFSALLTAIIPLTTSFGQLLFIMMLMGVSSGFFGQSIAWAAEQIEARVRKVGAIGISSETGSPARLQSHLTRGIGFNRMIGDLGLILGPLFVGFVVSMFSSDPLSWFIAFGATSVVIGVASLLIIQPLQLRKESE